MYPLYKMRPSQCLARFGDTPPILTARRYVTHRIKMQGIIAQLSLHGPNTRQSGDTFSEVSKALFTVSPCSKMAVFIGPSGAHPEW